MEYSGISELFQVVYSSAIALHMLSGRAYVRALPASYTVYFGTYYFSIHLPLSLIEQLSTTMLKENIYVILVTQMINSFQVKYQSMLCK